VGRGDAMTAAAPSGVVTFLVTDIEGSTRRWEADEVVTGGGRLVGNALKPRKAASTQRSAASL